MNKKAAFGSYKAHQPNYEGFIQLGKLDDFIFQSLAHMGNASCQMSWANTVLENEKSVPAEIKDEMRRVTAQISVLQERLRSFKTFQQK
ncbi:hypothetical protein [Aneurinibacillus aneurinilyticus]|uniref:Uncharacterized protein n=1 Tax=Aneurinibacillus aneurinilyticus ATCC 12856 TaxID=649747 RepID=U1Y518_ANEAE|nr:hypothetical protein [Aneurinibacillus aneurinilyticus]ERI07247.1 hypothetical protein HMPREF0083_04718 [Aneurinibacillus aneurinilyticus ATCC 12856]MED0709652.1 hypothetical protein [Aneurinibacillus aneurinilyticus]MED0726432.1 hypothetical protein [Aneurinibacillus aneurinilyticus]MED0730394.1 hypothetical protein [Aneurinibacillus aneurinilyticus]MED0739223.1 hypothetical protein [Aneurinibacillus aneurinilyticus]